MKKPIATSDMNHASFDVVVVPFPYADRLAEMRRPALVVSAPALQKRFGLVWLMMITSADNPAWDLRCGDFGLEAGGRSRALGRPPSQNRHHRRHSHPAAGGEVGGEGCEEGEGSSA